MPFSFQLRSIKHAGQLYHFLPSGLRPQNCSLSRAARFFLDCKSSSAASSSSIGRRWFHPRNSIVVSGRLKYRNGRRAARGRDIKQQLGPGKLGKSPSIPLSLSLDMGWLRNAMLRKPALLIHAAQPQPPSFSVASSVGPSFLSAAIRISLNAKFLNYLSTIG